MLETTEDSPLLIFEANSHLQDYSYQDVEDNEWFNIQIVDLPVEGTLKLDGSLLQANATLSVDQIERLEYIPKENWNGENGEKDTFKLKVNDNAVNTQGIGGNSYNPYSEAVVVSITVNAINDAPTVTGATVSTGEDAAYTFSIQAFNQDYSDAESNTLVNVKFETLPNNGTLKLGLQPVTVNQEIPGDQISQLTFVPIAYSQDKEASDSAIAELDKFISSKKVDKSSPRWRLGLPKPPQADFGKGDTDYFWNIETNKGLIKVKLWPDVAPMHVSSTIYLTRLGFYDTLPFHRVITGFMAQGGCQTGTGRDGPGYQFGGEFSKDLKHDSAGVLSTANAGPGTDGSQFFLTFVPTPWLDDKHTIFGKLVEGFQALTFIQNAGSKDGTPTEEILIIKSFIETR